jgi:predicted esterase
VEIHHVPVTRTARVAVLGGGGRRDPEGKGVEAWTVLHGYRQLAPRFLRRFRGIASPHRRILAPEGLSRFYLASPDRVRDARGTVGASWMTREDRDAEISDYVGYLDTVTRKMGADGRHTVLGFSQGAHTAARWAVGGTSRIHRLVLWGAALPNDLPKALPADLPADPTRRLQGVELVLVRGASDPLRNPAEEAREEAWLQGVGLPYRVEMHHGGHEIDPTLLAALAKEAPG